MKKTLSYRLYTEDPATINLFDVSLKKGVLELLNSLTLKDLLKIVDLQTRITSDFNEPNIDVELSIHVKDSVNDYYLHDHLYGKPVRIIDQHYNKMLIWNKIDANNILNSGTSSEFKIKEISLKEYLSYYKH